MSKILHHPWWLLSKRQLEPPATPRFNVGVISKRSTWFGAHHPTLKQGDSRGIALGNGGRTDDQKKRSLKPTVDKNRISIISELLNLEFKCTLLVMPTSITQHRSKQNNESLLHASSTTRACNWCKIFTFNSTSKNLQRQQISELGFWFWGNHAAPLSHGDHEASEPCVW